LKIHQKPHNEREFCGAQYEASSCGTESREDRFVMKWPCTQNCLIFGTIWRTLSNTCETRPQTTTRSNPKMHAPQRLSVG